jgi:hypothetical protein
LQRDYVARRKKAYHGSSSESNNNNGNNGGGDDTIIWDGVSKIERELVGCCEQSEQQHDAPTTTTAGEGGDPSEGGALNVEKEVRFVGFLARDCHSMSSRCLALAILERTLETYLHELKEDEDDEDDEEEEENEEEEVDDDVASDDERDDDWKPGKRRSPRHRKNQQQERRKKQKPKDIKEEPEEVGRLEQFLAAGGLEVLNRWLIEAAHQEELPPPLPLKKAPPPGSNNKKPEQPTTSTAPPNTLSAPTRPLILPILRFLERIPFDKKIVVDSKINKQIRKLGRQVDDILEARARGKHRAEDLDNWTTEPTSAETDALDHVKEAVDAVKKSWEEMAKKQTEKFTDPFESLKEKMRERLSTLTQFEGGKIEKPDWLETQETTTKDTKKKALQKSSTQELALRERQAEREDLKNALRVAEDEHRARIARLRETLRKRKEENAPSNRHKNVSGKKVVWKDGLTQKNNRKRQVLEEVFVYIKNTPANPEIGTAEESLEENLEGDSKSDGLDVSMVSQNDDVDQSLL